MSRTFIRSFRKFAQETGVSLSYPMQTSEWLSNKVIRYRQMSFHEIRSRLTLHNVFVILRGCCIVDIRPKHILKVSFDYNINFIRPIVLKFLHRIRQCHCHALYKFQNNWVTTYIVIGKRDFTRLKMRFIQLCFWHHHPCVHRDSYKSGWTWHFRSRPTSGGGKHCKLSSLQMLTFYMQYILGETGHSTVFV